MFGSPSEVAEPELLDWRADRTVVVSDDDREVWMFGGPAPIRLAGAGTGLIARSIDGSRVTDEVVVAAVQAGLDEDWCRGIIAKWMTSGHVVPTTRAGASRIRKSRHAARLVDRTSSDPQQVVDLSTALDACGVALESEDREDSPDLSIIVVDDLLDAEHALSVERGPALMVCLRGSRVVVSPVFHSHGSAGFPCPTCFAARVGQRRVSERVAAHRLGRVLPPPHPVRHPAAAVAAATVIRSILDADEPAHDVTILDPSERWMRTARLIAVAGCETCNPGGPLVAQSHVAQSHLGPVSLLADDHDPVDAATGAYRSVDPEDTWLRFSHLVDDVVGVVPFVSPMGPGLLHAYMAGVNAAAVDDVVAMGSIMRSGAGGKGITRAGARTGALAEALERDALRARGSEPRRRGRMADIAGAFHPNEIELFSRSQLEATAAFHSLGLTTYADERGHRPVPLPFDVDAEHDWSPVAHIRTGEVRWVPSSILWFGWQGGTPGAWRAHSNGVAAGNSLTEAALQGLLELVERDSVSLWWHARATRPAFDLDACPDHRLQAALSPQRELGTRVWVLDVTTDLGIPSAVAVATGLEPVPSTPLLGFGAHVDPVIAVVRALTELAQTQAAVLETKRLDTFGSKADQIWFGAVTVDSDPWLLPHGSVALGGAPVHGSLGDALGDVVARIERAGVDVWWADCTRTDIGFPVVRTYAPGLRHFWNRYAPGRLYDVPVRLGWREPGYGEADVNPLAMIL